MLGFQIERTDGDEQRYDQWLAEGLGDQEKENRYTVRELGPYDCLSNFRLESPSTTLATEFQ